MAGKTDEKKCTKKLMFAGSEWSQNGEYLLSQIYRMQHTTNLGIWSYVSNKLAHLDNYIHIFTSCQRSEGQKPHLLPEATRQLSASKSSMSSSKRMKRKKFN
jgi:hypothetical protein